jgi:hypothetical protein
MPGRAKDAADQDPRHLRANDGFFKPALQDRGIHVGIIKQLQDTNALLDAKFCPANPHSTGAGSCEASKS